MVKSIQRGFVDVNQATFTIITISAVNPAKCEIQFDRQYVYDVSGYRNRPTSDRPAVISSTELKLNYTYVATSPDYDIRGWWTVIEYE